MLSYPPLTIEGHLTHLVDQTVAHQSQSHPSPLESVMSTPSPAYSGDSSQANGILLPEARGERLPVLHYRAVET